MLGKFVLHHKVITIFRGGIRNFRRQKLRKARTLLAAYRLNAVSNIRAGRLNGRRIKRPGLAKYGERVSKWRLLARSEYPVPCLNLVVQNAETTSDARRALFKRIPVKTKPRRKIML